MMIMRTNKVAFLHLRHTDQKKVTPKGGITVAYELENIDGSEAFVNIKYNFSSCSEKDHYNRKIGNRVAAGRLRVKGPVSNYVAYKDSWFDQFESYLFDFLDLDLPVVNTSRAKVRIG
jgi:hypothetical protein